MSLSPEYFKFLDEMRGFQRAAAEPPPKIQAMEGCNAPGCKCGRPPAIVVFPMRIESPRSSRP